MPPFVFKVEGQHPPFIIIQVEACVADDESSKIKPMDPCVPLLVFTPDAGHKEHLSSKMNFDIRSFQLCLFNSQEVLLSLTPDVITIANSFPLGEELFFYCQQLLSKKYIFLKTYIFMLIS